MDVPKTNVHFTDGHPDGDRLGGHLSKNLLHEILQRMKNLKNQIILTTLNSFIFNQITIKKLNINMFGLYKHQPFITNEDLQNKMCHDDRYLWGDVIALYASDNNRITDINFMRENLKVLQANGVSCTLTQESIKNLQLIELQANDNYQITDVNFMKDTLRVLHADSFHYLGSGLTQAGIKDLHLIM